jgi:hypothetical protein
MIGIQPCEVMLNFSADLDERRPGRGRTRPQPIDVAAFSSRRERGNFSARDFDAVAWVWMQASRDAAQSFYQPRADPVLPPPEDAALMQDATVLLQQQCEFIRHPVGVGKHEADAVVRDIRHPALVKLSIACADQHRIVLELAATLAPFAVR